MDPSPFSFEEFRDPPKSARPLVRWWWTGTDVETAELLREVRELDAAGFLGGEIQAFMMGSPLDLARSDPARFQRSHRYMQPAYYEMVKAVLDEAARRGMRFDLTVCSGWPAGGVHVTKSESLKMLLMASRTLKGPRRFRGRLPRCRRPLLYPLTKLIPFTRRMLTYLPRDMRLVRVVAARPIGKPGAVRSLRPRTALLDSASVIDLTGQVNADGILEWEVPDGVWQVFACYGGPSGARPLASSQEDGGGASLVLDHFARFPIELHLERHLGRAQPHFGEHFGAALRAFFTDSLELMTEWTWTDDFLAEFERRRGYDLTPYLPVNYVPGRDNVHLSSLMGHKRPCFDFEGDLGERIRYDFEQTVSDLFTERFVQAMTDWAHRHGLQNRLQAYGVRADTLKAYGIADIPETEQLFAGGMLDFLRLAGSAGALYDKPIVTAEAMVWNQRDYLTTPLKWKVAADRLFVAGINQMIYHGFPYQHPAFPHPGFDAFSSPYLPKLLCYSSNFGRTNPFWEFFPLLNGYVTRCQYVLQQGQPVTNVGLYYPLFNYPDAPLKQEELVGGWLDETDAPLARRAFDARVKQAQGAEERWLCGQLALADDLLAHGYTYTHVNAESLLGARVESGRLVMGALRLEALVFSDIERVPVEVAHKLEEIAAEGVHIVFVGRAPARQPGFFRHEERDREVAQAILDLTLRHGCHLAQPLELADHLAKRGVQPGLVFEQPQPTLQYAHRRCGTLDFYFLRHAGREPLKAAVRFPQVGKTPIVLDPWTGQAAPAAQYEAVGEGVRMDLTFSAYGSLLVAFRVGGDANAPHVVSADLPVTRGGNLLLAQAAAAGKYTFTLGDGSRRTLEVERDTPPAVLVTDWKLDLLLRSYTGNLTPLSLHLAELKDWREVPELETCSSTGVYSTHVMLDGRYLRAGLAVTLDLGRVHDAAIVEVNGHRLEPLLVPPFAVDVTRCIRAGDNEIRVTVTPCLRNRLIGYGKFGGRDWRQFKRRKESAPSGLVGPVELLAEWQLEI